MSEVDAAIQELKEAIKDRVWAVFREQKTAADDRVVAAEVALRALLTPTISEADVEAGADVVKQWGIWDDDEDRQIVRTLLEAVAAARQKGHSS